MEDIEDETYSMIIYIEDYGYYADKQNNKSYNFTENYKYAKHYKTEKSAYHNLLNKITHDEIFKNKKIYLQPLRIKQIIKYDLEKLIETNIKYEPKHEVKFVEEESKVKVIIDDDFWN